MRIRAMALRILKQFRGDRRTLALMAGAPLLMLTLIFFILNSTSYAPSVGIVNAPVGYTDILYENNVEVIRCSEEEAPGLLEKGEIIAAVNLENNRLSVDINGTNKTNATQTIQLLENSKSLYLARLAGTGAQRADLATDINYIYGAEDMEMFDNFGAAMIGILIFFFVFLISGISFLQERTSGTLERLLSTPIRRYEIVIGYVLGFGIITVVQAALITLYVVYVLKVMMVGSVFLVMLIALLSAITALTMGLLASTAAENEFQVIQFIPLVVVPQIFFSGLFTLSGIMQYIGYFMPVYYIADALTKVMIKGYGFAEVFVDIAALLGFITLFMTINTKLLKKYRRI